MPHLTKLKATLYTRVVKGLYVLSFKTVGYTINHVDKNGAETLIEFKHGSHHMLDLYLCV